MKSVFALAEQHVNQSSEMVSTSAGWTWATPQSQAAAQSNSFADWYQLYFAALTPDDVSWTDSQPIVDELRRYQEAE